MIWETKNMRKAKLHIHLYVKLENIGEKIEIQKYISHSPTIPLVILSYISSRIWIYIHTWMYIGRYMNTHTTV